MVKVFLGGTCNESIWRELLIPMLDIDYFNPVVDDWNEECQLREIQERENADFCLYVITPLMLGMYSIAEVVDDSNKRPEKTILCVLDVDYNEKDKEIALMHSDEWDNLVGLEGLLEMNCHGYTWGESPRHSLKAVEKLVESNGAKVFNRLWDVALFLNHTIQ
jgi:hypothetical protein